MQNCSGKITLIGLSLLLVSLGFIFLAAAEETQLDSVYAVCPANRVNIRSGAGTNFEVLGQLNKNQQALVTGQENDWYKIRLPHDALCFVHKDYIKNKIVCADKLYLRAGAGENFNALGFLTKGQAVEVLAEENSWLKIVPPPSCAGWIKKDYLRLMRQEVMPQEEAVTRPQENIFTASGMINDLGMIIERAGTHKLVQDKKVLYYLKSANIDLNRYIYQNVMVEGELLKPKGSGYPVINVIRLKQLR